MKEEDEEEDEEEREDEEEEAGEEEEEEAGDGEGGGEEGRDDEGEEFLDENTLETVQDFFLTRLPARVERENNSASWSAFEEKKS